MVIAPGPESIPSHFQFKRLHIIAIDGEFLLYVFYTYIVTGIQHAGCTKHCRCKSMASSPCSGSKLFKFVGLFCSIASSLLTTVAGADEKHSLPPIRELHTMMAYYANLRDDAEKREKLHLRDQQVSSFQFFCPQNPWAYCFHFSIKLKHPCGKCDRTHGMYGIAESLISKRKYIFQSGFSMDGMGLIETTRRRCNAGSTLGSRRFGRT